MVKEHFEYLKKLTEKGVVILAGPSLEPPYTGIVVFRATDPVSARKVMSEDPAVEGGIFRARLAPFKISLMQSGKG